jgi:hypothetical protein
VVLVTRKLAAGNNSLTASYSGDAILTSSVSSPIPMAVADYILQVLPTSIKLKEGSSESVTLNLIPQGGFTSPIQLACSNLPEDVTCKFSKSTVTLDGINPATVSLTFKAATSAEVIHKAVSVIITGTSVVGTTPKQSTLDLTLKK